MKRRGKRAELIWSGLVPSRLVASRLVSSRPVSSFPFIYPLAAYQPDFTMLSHALFIEQLERERATFGDGACHLSTYQTGPFQLYCELLREDATSLAKRSKQRRSVRLRARTLLVDVFSDLGCEMFLLCTLTTTISTLATIPIKGLVPALRRWWKGVSHPNGLAETANKVCESNSINALISALTLLSTKRRISTDNNGLNTLLC